MRLRIQEELNIQFLYHQNIISHVVISLCISSCLTCYRNLCHLCFSHFMSEHISIPNYLQLLTTWTDLLLHRLTVVQLFSWIFIPLIIIKIKLSYHNWPYLYFVFRQRVKKMADLLYYAYRCVKIRYFILCVGMYNIRVVQCISLK